MTGKGFTMRKVRHGLRDTLEGSLTMFKRRFDMGHLGVRIGLPDGINQRDADGNDTGVALTTIGRAHEFGTIAVGGHIPERSWLRGGLRASRKEIAEVQKRILKILANGNMEARTALNFTGQAAVKGVKKYIMSRPFQPLADSTLAARSRAGKKVYAKDGSDNTTPLVDEGDMYREISYEVTER
jgi:hypothetical protein